MADGMPGPGEAFCVENSYHFVLRCLRPEIARRSNETFGRRVVQSGLIGSTRVRLLQMDDKGWEFAIGPYGDGTFREVVPGEDGFFEVAYTKAASGNGRKAYRPARGRLELVGDVHG